MCLALTGRCLWLLEADGAAFDMNDVCHRLEGHYTMARTFTDHTQFHPPWIWVTAERPYVSGCPGISRSCMLESGPSIPPRLAPGSKLALGAIEMTALGVT